MKKFTYVVIKNKKVVRVKQAGSADQARKTLKPKADEVLFVIVGSI